MNDLTREELNFLSAALGAYKFWEHTTRENAPSGKSFFDMSDELKGKIGNALASLIPRVRVTWVAEGEGPYEAEVVARRSGAMDLRFIDDGYDDHAELYTFEQRGSSWFEINNHSEEVKIEDV